MLDIQLKPEKYLTAEDVSSLVGGNEELVQQMYRSHLIDAAELRRGKVMFSPSEARRWKNWYWEHWRDYEKYLCASEKILAGFFAAGASVALMLGAIGLWKQGIPVLLALGLILPAAFLVPLPRPRPGRRFQQVQVTVAGIATGLFLSDILQRLGHNEPEIGYVALMMMVCVLVCFCLDKPSYRMEEYALSLKPGAYMCFMAAIGGLALAWGGPALGVNIGFIPSLIVGAAIFAAAALAQLMRQTNTYAFGITVPVAAYFGWEAAVIALFTVAGLLVISSLARHYVAEKEDASLAELMSGGSW
jgi:membrane protein